MKDYLAEETEEKFFDDLDKMERDFLTSIGDEEALAIIDAENAEIARSIAEEKQ